MTLEDLLIEWLPRQRWFAAKGRPVRSLRVAARTPLMTGGPLLDHLLLAVTFDDGSPVQYYQLLLGRREPGPDHRPDQLRESTSPSGAVQAGEGNSRAPRPRM